MDGHTSVCKPCKKIQRAAWAAKNKGQIVIASKVYYEENRGKIAAKIRNRESKVRVHTPDWADMEKVNAIYKEAQRRTKADGINYHVDHIVPISHELVCGLHNEFNLQILTQWENDSKSNTFKVGVE